MVGRQMNRWNEEQTGTEEKRFREEESGRDNWAKEAERRRGS